MSSALSRFIADARRLWTSAEKPGSFLQGMYDSASRKCWQAYGPKQVPYKLE